MLIGFISGYFCFSHFLYENTYCMISLLFFFNYFSNVRTSMLYFFPVNYFSFCTYGAVPTVGSLLVFTFVLSARLSSPYVICVVCNTTILFYLIPAFALFPSFGVFLKLSQFRTCVFRE